MKVDLIKTNYIHVWNSHTVRKERKKAKWESALCQSKREEFWRMSPELAGFACLGVETRNTV